MQIVSQKGNVATGNVVGIINGDKWTSPEAIAANLMAQTSDVYKDLPRLVNPRGVDDTDKVIQMIEERYPVLPWYPDQTHNRRTLYMSIYNLRKNVKHGGIGWQCDKEVKKGTYAQEIGQSRLN
jgi:hypothetical protein